MKVFIFYFHKKYLNNIYVNVSEKLLHCVGLLRIFWSNLICSIKTGVQTFEENLISTESLLPTAHRSFLTTHFFTQKNKYIFKIKLI